MNARCGKVWSEIFLEFQNSKVSSSAQNRICFRLTGKMDSYVLIIDQLRHEYVEVTCTIYTYVLHVIQLVSYWCPVYFEKFPRIRRTVPWMFISGSGDDERKRFRIKCRLFVWHKPPRLNYSKRRLQCNFVYPIEVFLYVIRATWTQIIVIKR